MRQISLKNNRYNVQMPTSYVMAKFFVPLYQLDK